MATQAMFNARLSPKEFERLEMKARRRGVTKTALLREWIEQEDVPTVGDVPAFIRRNQGNTKLRISG